MTFKPPGSPTTPVEQSLFAVISESPLNILDPRFNGDNTGVRDSAAAVTAVNAHLGTYGGEVIFPAGTYLFSSNPTITKNGVTLRGIGGASVQLEKIIVQADNFRAENFTMTERAGVVAGNGKAFYIDPDGAGRTLTGVHLSDMTFNDFFYAVDFRGSATNKIKRIRCENLISSRVASGNAGHFNFFYVQDVTTVGLGTYGGQNSASQNFGNGDGAINVIGGNDSDNDVSGGALNFENFFASAKVQVIGGSWGWAIPSGTDAFALTIDDVEDVTVAGADFGGYVRVQTSTGTVRKARIMDCQMTRFRAQAGTGSPLTIEELDLLNCTIRGVPGVSATAGINLDGNYVRKCRVLGNYVKRYQADGTTENWSTGAVSVARAAGLDLELDRNDFGGRPIVGSSSGGVVRFGQDNVNFGALTSITKSPAQTPVKAGIPADADYDISLLSGQGPVVDSSNNRVYFRVGSTWKFAALT